MNQVRIHWKLGWRAEKIVLVATLLNIFLGLGRTNEFALLSTFVDVSRGIME